MLHHTECYTLHHTECYMLHHKLCYILHHTPFTVVGPEHITSATLNSIHNLMYSTQNSVPQTLYLTFCTVNNSHFSCALLTTQNHLNLKQFLE